MGASVKRFLRSRNAADASGVQTNVFVVEVNAVSGAVMQLSGNKRQVYSLWGVGLTGAAGDQAQQRQWAWQAELQEQISSRVQSIWGLC